MLQFDTEERPEKSKNDSNIIKDNKILIIISAILILLIIFLFYKIYIYIETLKKANNSLTKEIKELKKNTLKIMIL